MRSCVSGLSRTAMRRRGAGSARGTMCKVSSGCWRAWPVSGASSSAPSRRHAARLDARRPLHRRQFNETIEHVSASNRDQHEAERRPDRKLQRRTEQHRREAHENRQMDEVQRIAEVAEASEHASREVGFAGPVQRLVQIARKTKRQKLERAILSEVEGDAAERG